jgi:uncharacterized membrane protein YiaA
VETPVVFNKFWVALWAGNVAILLALFAGGISPLGWFAAFVVLFLVPEMIGVRVRGDSLPPLTYATRRYVKRWVPDAVTWAVGAWMAYAWCIPVDGVTKAQHPLAVFVAIFTMCGWLTNHWDVTYDGFGE